MWLKEHFIFTNTDGMLFHYLVEGTSVKDSSKVPPDVRSYFIIFHTLYQNLYFWYLNLGLAFCLDVYEALNLFVGLYRDMPPAILNVIFETTQSINRCM